MPAGNTHTKEEVRLREFTPAGATGMKEEVVEENTGKKGRSGCRPAPAEGVDPVHPLTWQQVGTQTIPKTIPKPLAALASREPVPAAAG